MTIDALNETQADSDLITGDDPKTSTWNGKTIRLSEEGKPIFARKAIQNVNQNKKDRYSELSDWTAERMQSYKQKARDKKAAAAFKKAREIVMGQCLDSGKISDKDQEILRLMARIENSTSTDAMMMLKEILNDDYTLVERQSAEKARFVVNAELLTYASQGLNRWGFQPDQSNSALGDQVHISRMAKISVMDYPNLIHTAIGFINGMDNEFDYACESAALLSDYAAAKISLVYNATHGKLGDSFAALWGKCSGLPSYNESLLLFQWEEFFQTHGPDAKFLQICHSKGAIHVKTALQYARADIKDKIVVLAIAPVSVIRPVEDCHEAFNYVSDKDTWIKRLHLDFLGDKKYLEILSPHSDAKGNDHSFNSPTFQGKIDEKIKQFIEKYERSK